MAKVHGVAGEWARVKGTVLGLWPLFLGVFIAGASVAILFMDILWGCALLIVSFAFIAWMLQRGMRRIESFYKGARGEERVAAILKTLPETYHVFNDFLACGKHVDHVVVGPTGVFAIETKFWLGRVTIEDGHILVDGELPDREPLNQVHHEAALVKAQLEKSGWSGSVTPILAFASNTFNAQPAECQGAIIINACELKSTFEIGRAILAPQELDRIVALMCVRS